MPEAAMPEKEHPINGSWAELTEVDKIIHEPARLAVLTILDAVESADFLYLQKATQLTKGNLSVHLTKLEDAGLLEIQKSFQGKIPRTLCRLTLKGKDSFEAYKVQMKGILG
jgi:DNA-binding transcriptional ArsR family regulator